MVPLKRKSEVMSAVKQFTKEIGAPDAIVCNMSMEETLPEIKTFLNDIGMTLRVPLREHRGPTRLNDILDC